MSRAWKVDGLDPDAPAAFNARQVLAVRIAEFYSWAPIVDQAERLELLHELRISAKRMRYTLEAFRPIFGEESEASLQRLRSIQEVLGRLHDHDVRIALIEDELLGLSAEQAADLNGALAGADPDAMTAIAAASFRPPPDDPRRGLIHLLSRQHASRLAIHHEFKALWDELRNAGMRSDLVKLSSLPISEHGGTLSMGGVAKRSREGLNRG